VHVVKGEWQVQLLSAFSAFLAAERSLATLEGAHLLVRALHEPFVFRGCRLNLPQHCLLPAWSSQVT
jgi:hypothetical protein